MHHTPVLPYMYTCMYIYNTTVHVNVSSCMYMYNVLYKIMMDFTESACTYSVHLHVLHCTCMSSSMTGGHYNWQFQGEVPVQ